jgi:hypothetical protein
MGVISSLLRLVSETWKDVRGKKQHTLSKSLTLCEKVRWPTYKIVVGLIF